jgi:formate/nitrite transporter FocA (FNT family)
MIGLLEMSMMEKKISIFLLCSSIYLVTLGNLIDSILALLVNQH